MRTTSIFSLLIALLASTACSSDTGILINASAPVELAQEIQYLRFYVGQDLVDSTGYYSDDNPLEDVYLEGRDIAEDPYSLLVRPGDADAEVMIAVLAYGSQDEAIGFGRLDTGVRFISGRVLSWDVPLEPLRGGVFEARNDCLKWGIGDGEFIHIGRPGDQDCDGVREVDGDCDDLNPNRYPGNTEDCTNGIDDDCNELIDGDDDLAGDALADNDGYGACGDGPLDCNNADPFVNPGAAEQCNGIDDDCDGRCDDGFDSDGDGVSTCGSIIEGGSCEFLDEENADCDDGDAEVYPGHEEICDGKDNDCNGICEDNSDLDPDEDGFTSCGSFVNQCGLNDEFADCEPENPDVHPGHQELCDSIDNNCDGELDPEATPCFVSSGDACREGTRGCQGGTLSDTCQANDAIVDDSICDSYEQCQAPDPLECVLNGDNLAIGTQEDCTAGISGLGQCQQRTVLISSPDGQNAECTYSIIGGAVQQGYQVSLIDADGGSPTLSVASCQAVLEVKALPGSGTAFVLINYSSEQTPSHLIEIRLKADVHDSCNGQLGLDCNTWNNVPTPLAQPQN